MQTALIIWFLLTAGLIGAVFVRKTNHRQPLPKPEEFVVLALANGALIVSVQILYKALSNAKLQELLEWDGILALCIGSGFGLYLAIKEIWKLF